MINPRTLGDKHVLNVHQALMLKLKQKPITTFPRTVIATVEYILELYPNIVSAECKFQAGNTNTAKDMTLVLDDNSIVHVNLFLIKKNSNIQMKNLGAKSFFAKYFLSDSLQKKFNEVFEKHYNEFLKGIIKQIGGIVALNHDVRTMKRIILNYYPRFTPEIEDQRNKFLYNLREEAFMLLKDSYNDKDKGFNFAYHSLFMTKDTTIITRYGRYESSVTVERFSPSPPYFNMIDIYKKGRNSVGIKYGDIALILRFKFESGPTSSIKLATTYEMFPSEAENEAANKKTVRKMTTLIENHQYLGGNNQSNAIGKCHEALTYYYFLIYFPDVLQVERDECIDQFNKYFQIVKPEVLQKLYQSTSTIIPAIREKLNEKYWDYKIESIELVPESYIENRLETGDIQLTLKVNQSYKIESISLKAVANKGAKLTTKNPGIGTILGPTYFNIGDMKPFVKTVRERYENEELNHRQSLELIAIELGRQLESASQYHLKQGIENLLGTAMMAITFYKNYNSICKVHSRIDSKIIVKPQTPTEIQNTLTWNNDEESIHLRVKFSRGQTYGWSSIKLTSEYLIK